MAWRSLARSLRSVCGLANGPPWTSTACRWRSTSVRKWLRSSEVNGGRCCQTCSGVAAPFAGDRAVALASIRAASMSSQVFLYENDVLPRQREFEDGFFDQVGRDRLRKMKACRSCSRKLDADLLTRLVNVMSGGEIARPGALSFMCRSATVHSPRSAQLMLRVVMFQQAAEPLFAFNRAAVFFLPDHT